MDSEQNWAEALNISPEKLAEWGAQAPPEKPLLVWCLEQSLVSVDDYLAWASSRYSLPILDTTFFHSGFSSELMAKAHRDGGWNAWIYPVESWENITIIACAEPPPEEEREAHVRYVLADPSAMREAWGHDGSIRTQTQELPPVPTDHPVGLSVTPKAFKLNLDDSLFEPTSAAAAHPPSVTDAKAAMSNEAITVDLSMEDEVADATPEMPTTVPIIKTIVQPPLPTKVTAPPQSAETKTPVASPAPAPAISASSDLQTAAASLLTTLETRYEAALIMRCADGLAKPQFWSKSLSIPDAEKASVNLNYATFLRIVAKTGMPYHGYLVDSPAHAEFFTAIGRSKLPVSTTAVPVKVDGKLWAIVIALGAEEAAKMETLHFAQENVDDCFLPLADELSRAA